MFLKGHKINVGKHWELSKDAKRSHAFKLLSKIDNRKEHLRQLFSQDWLKLYGYIPKISWGAEIAQDAMINYWYKQLDRLIHTHLYS